MEVLIVAKDGLAAAGNNIDFACVDMRVEPLHYHCYRGQKQASYSFNYTLLSQCCKQSRQLQMTLCTCVIRVVFHFTCAQSSESFCHFIRDE